MLGSDGGTEGCHSFCYCISSVQYGILRCRGHSLSRKFCVIWGIRAGGRDVTPFVILPYDGVFEGPFVIVSVEFCFIVFCVGFRLLLSGS
jgi:hypothetical protein